MTDADDDATWPVVVVGAGPAGLVLAWMLHRAGVGVLVLDRSIREELGRLPKAGSMEHRVARMLERAGLGAPVLELGTENRRCEFRTPEATSVVDYGELTGGRGHVILPQHRVVERVCDALLDAGAPVRFAHRVHEVRDGAEEAVLDVERPDGTRGRIRARAVVGADGAASAVARAVTAAPDVRVHDRRLPGRWLVVSAATPPLVGHTIYAAHPRGFAGHLRRGPDETRFYLEIPSDQGVDDWPPGAIRTELAERLGAGDALADAGIGEVGVLDLRTRVVEPMAHGRLFLVGDAAHLITPAGGKGMNLALADAVELAHALVATPLVATPLVAGPLVTTDAPTADGSPAAAWSTSRVAATWRAQAFSEWFLRILSARSAGAGDPADGADGVHGIRAGWVDALGTDPLLARWFAHAYAGVDA